VDDFPEYASVILKKLLRSVASLSSFSFFLTNQHSSRNLNISPTKNNEYIWRVLEIISAMHSYASESGKLELSSLQNCLYSIISKLQPSNEEEESYTLIFI